MCRSQEVTDGLYYITTADKYFNEAQFIDKAIDIFFSVQNAWARMDLAPVSPMLADVIAATFTSDLQAIKAEGKQPHMDNLAVRNSQITEVWQEEGRDYITVLFSVRALDYTTDASGAVVAGSKTDPVTFDEYWTFARQTGNNPWKLSAIDAG